MPIRFFARDHCGPSVEITRPQAQHLLPLVTDDGNGQVPQHGCGAVEGLLDPALILTRTAAVRRELTNGRVKEFTATLVSKDTLVKFILGIEVVAKSAASLRGPIHYRDVEETP